VRKGVQQENEQKRKIKVTCYGGGGGWNESFRGSGGFHIRDLGKKNVGGEGWEYIDEILWRGEFLHLLD